MEPKAVNGTTQRRLVDRLAIGVLIGVVVVSVGGVALLTVYLNRLGDAAAGLQRVTPLPSYPGRPTPMGVDGVNAVNYLLMTTKDDGTLEAVVIAHLSASRRDLTLVALPSDLLADNGSERTTLAASFAQDPLLTARAVESLTGARMDHQVRLDLDGFGSVVDSLGGISLNGATLDGAQVVALLTEAPDAVTRSTSTADLVRAALARANLGVTIADPNRFDKVMDALTPCLTVDAELTSDEIRNTMVESRVRADHMVTWPLASSPSVAGAEPDPAGVAELRSALAADLFPTPVASPSDPGTTPPQSIVANSTPATPGQRATVWSTPAASPSPSMSPATDSTGSQVGVASTPVATR